MDNLYIELIGWTGAALMLWAYIALVLKKFRSTSKSYFFLNFVGAMFLVINCFYNRAIPSVTTNVIWVCFAAYGFSKVKRNRKILSRTIKRDLKKLRAIGMFKYF